MEIITWNNKYAKDFKILNLQWLEEYFFVEPHDEEVLGNPEEFIIRPGGNILFLKEGKEIVGCLAFLKISEGIFELTKMAILKEQRGKQLGNYLLKEGIDFARSHSWRKLILYSNRKLENAIHLYRKYGFIEIAIEESNPYTRGDIKMELNLS